jgi:hypothetical protein
MRAKAAATVAAWAGANAVLAGLLSALGGRGPALLVYAAATVLAGLVAAAVLLSRRFTGQRSWTEPDGAGGVIFFAAAALAAGMALAYGWWLLILTAIAAAAGVLREIAGHRARQR